MRRLTVALCLVLCANALQARQQAPSTVADPVTLTLRLAGDRRQFKPGEVIPIQLEFTSPVPKRFVVDRATYDRSGRLTIDEFTVEPNERVGDPLLDGTPPAVRHRQLPAGTVFTLNVDALARETASNVTSRIKKVAEAHGILVR